MAGVEHATMVVTMKVLAAVQDALVLGLVGESAKEQRRIHKCAVRHVRRDIEGDRNVVGGAKVPRKYGRGTAAWKPRLPGRVWGRPGAWA